MTLASSCTFAMPNDLFMQATPETNTLTTSLSLDLVNDTVDFFKLRQSEGVNGDSGDYIGAHLSAIYQFHPEWSISGSYWHRNIEFSEDTNKLNSAALSFKFSPEQLSTKKSNLAFQVSIWGNRADEVGKSTPTYINKYKVDEVSVIKPHDLQLQLDTIYTHKIDVMNQINVFGSIGHSKVKVNKLDVTTQARGCKANLTINDNNQYTGQPVGKCIIDGLIVKDLKLTGNANDLGLDIAQDLNYNSYFASLGGSWNWRYRKFESQLAYQYQRLWRKDIDDRINNFGNTPIKDNHTIGAKFSYDFSTKVTAYLRGEIYQHNLIGYVPFLYNGVTASRLDKRYGLASIGIEYRGF